MQLAIKKTSTSLSLSPTHRDRHTNTHTLAQWRTNKEIIYNLKFVKMGSLKEQKGVEQHPE